MCELKQNCDKTAQNSHKYVPMNQKCSTGCDVTAFFDM